MQINQYP